MKICDLFEQSYDHINAKISVEIVFFDLQATDENKVKQVIDSVFKSINYSEYFYNAWSTFDQNAGQDIATKLTFLDGPLFGTGSKWDKFKHKLNRALYKKLTNHQETPGLETKLAIFAEDYEKAEDLLNKVINALNMNFDPTKIHVGKINREDVSRSKHSYFMYTPMAKMSSMDALRHMHQDTNNETE